MRQRYLCPSVLMGEKEKSGEHFFEYRQSCYKKYFNLYNFFKKPSFFVSVQRNIIYQVDALECIVLNVYILREFIYAAPK